MPSFRPGSRRSGRQQLLSTGRRSRWAPEEFRVALVLRELDGMAYAEVAAALGMAVGTVKSRVHRGRMMLKELLQHKLGDETDAV